MTVALADPGVNGDVRVDDLEALQLIAFYRRQVHVAARVQASTHPDPMHAKAFALLEQAGLYILDLLESNRASVPDIKADVAHFLYVMQMSGYFCEPGITLLCRLLELEPRMDMTGPSTGRTSTDD